MYAVRTLRRGSLSFLSVDNAADSKQLSAKTADLKNLLADFPVEEWCAPVSGPEQGFRNKAKMVVSGSVEKPLLGMLHRDGTPEDLCDCPLYPASFAPVFAALKPFIARAGLTPYNVARKRGELKYILLTESQSDGGMCCALYCVLIPSWRNCVRRCRGYTNNYRS